MLSSLRPLLLDFLPTQTPWLRERQRLGDQGRGGGGLVLEGGGDDLSGLVVSGESVDSRLDENESELGVLVLSELVQVGSDGNGLLDQAVKVLGQLRGHTGRLEDSEDLVSGHESDLEGKAKDEE